MILVIFILSVFVAALVCIGIWEASQGKHDYLPNHKVRFYDHQILYFIRYFLTKKVKKKVYYTSKDTEWLVDQSKLLWIKDVLRKWEINGRHTWVNPILNTTPKYAMTENLFEDLNIKIETDTYVNGVRIYKEYEQYIYPTWVVKPLIGCVKCFSSVYGTLVALAMTKQYIALVYDNWLMLISYLTIHALATVSAITFLKRYIK